MRVATLSRTQADLDLLARDGARAVRADAGDPDDLARALCHAAAQELRQAGVHVALLVVDGIIQSPKTARMTATMPADALVRQEDVSAAVAFLATQSARGMTHELLLTAAGDRWVP